MCEKEYYQYLNEVWNECFIAAGADREKTKVFFDKAASPEYYWKQNTRQGGGGSTDNYGRERQPNNNPATEKQKKAVYAISKKNDMELPGNYDSMTIDQASAFIEKYGK